MTSAPNLLDFLADQLTDVETAWSVGTFGAIAEFTRDADEAAAISRGRRHDFGGDGARRHADRGVSRRASDCL